MWRKPKEKLGKVEICKLYLKTTTWSAEKTNVKKAVIKISRLSMQAVPLADSFL